MTRDSHRSNQFPPTDNMISKGSQIAPTYISVDMGGGAWLEEGQQPTTQNAEALILALGTVLNQQGSAE